MGKVIREFETEVTLVPSTASDEPGYCVIRVKFRGSIIDTFQGSTLEDTQQLLANAGYKAIPWTWPREKRHQLASASS